MTLKIEVRTTKEVTPSEFRDHVWENLTQALDRGSPKFALGDVVRILSEEEASGSKPAVSEEYGVVLVARLEGITTDEKFSTCTGKAVYAYEVKRAPGERPSGHTVLEHRLRKHNE